jgi:hypothetical protein
VPAGKVVVGNNPIIVSCPLPVLTMNSPVQLPNAQAGQPFSADLNAIAQSSCLNVQCSFSLVSAPTWLIMSAGGVVSGTPSGAGSASFTFTVSPAPLAVAVRSARIIFS